MHGTECITSMSFSIFDRWGNQVFSTTDPEACWDGYYNGQALDTAVFAYHLSATLANGDLVERHGNISLVR
jgi:gliding motility-associated-like protein